MEIISPSEFEKVRASSTIKITVIDVRERWEYEEENIGAVNIPLCTIPSNLAELEKYKSTQIICHCKTGKRSKQAAKFLEKNGFENIKSLDGGIQAYASQFPMVQD